MLAKLLDPYDLRARLYPSLLVIAPVAVSVTTLFGMYRTVASSAMTLLGASGMGFLLTRVARDAGKRIQDGLFAKWGGTPTTQLLRHCDTQIDAHTKSRYHATLSQGIGKSLPTAAEEDAHPAAADELYLAAALWLISRTRNQPRYRLLFKENVAYGFHRNMLGLRHAGAIVSFACLAFVAAKMGLLHTQSPYLTGVVVERVSPEVAVSLACSVAMFLVWTLLVSESAVKRSAYAYSVRLLECCDDLGTSKSPTKPSRNRKPKG